MGNVIGDILPLAIVVAISPMPIIAVILVLFSARATTNGPAFLVGWIVGLAVVGAIVLALSDAGDLSGDSGALHDRRGRAPDPRWAPPAGRDAPMAVATGARRGGRHTEIPHDVDSLTRVGAAGTGLPSLSAVNPKNLLLTIGAAVTIGQAGLTTGQEIGALVIFVLIGQRHRGAGGGLLAPRGRGQRPPASSRPRAGSPPTTRPSCSCCCWCSGPS